MIPNTCNFCGESKKVKHFLGFRICRDCWEHIPDVVNLDTVSEERIRGLYEERMAPSFASDYTEVLTYGNLSVDTLHGYIMFGDRSKGIVKKNIFYLKDVSDIFFSARNAKQQNSNVFADIQVSALIGDLIVQNFTCKKHVKCVAKRDGKRINFEIPGEVDLMSREILSAAERFRQTKVNDSLTLADAAKIAFFLFGPYTKEDVDFRKDILLSMWADEDHFGEQAERYEKIIEDMYKLILGGTTSEE